MVTGYVVHKVIMDEPHAQGTHLVVPAPSLLLMRIAAHGPRIQNEGMRIIVLGENRTDSTGQGYSLGNDVVMRGEQKERNVGHCLFEDLSDLESVHKGRRYVQNDKVG